MELERWLNSAIEREELIPYILEFLDIPAPLEKSPEYNVNLAEKCVCILCYRAALQPNNITGIID